MAPFRIHRSLLFSLAIIAVVVMVLAASCSAGRHSRGRRRSRLGGRASASKRAASAAAQAQKESLDARRNKLQSAHINEGPDTPLSCAGDASACPDTALNVRPDLQGRAMRACYRQFSDPELLCVRVPVPCASATTFHDMEAENEPANVQVWRRPEPADGRARESEEDDDMEVELTAAASVFGYDVVLVLPEATAQESSPWQQATRHALLHFVRTASSSMHWHNFQPRPLLPLWPVDCSHDAGYLSAILLEAGWRAILSQGVTVTNNTLASPQMVLT